MISGVYDLRPLRYSVVQPKLLLDHAAIERQSPLFHLPPGAPPVLIGVGAEESPEFRRQSRDYYSAWTGAGLEALYLEQTGRKQFTAIDGFLDPASPLFSAMDQFIRA